MLFKKISALLLLFALVSCPLMAKQVASSPPFPGVLSNNYVDIEEMMGRKADYFAQEKNYDVLSYNTTYLGYTGVLYFSVAHQTEVTLALFVPDSAVNLAILQNSILQNEIFAVQTGVATANQLRNLAQVKLFEIYDLDQRAIAQNKVQTLLNTLANPKMPFNLYISEDYFVITSSSIVLEDRIYFGIGFMTQETFLWQLVTNFK